MPEPHATTTSRQLPVLNAAITASMCRTTLKALGRSSALVSARGTVVGVVTAQGLEQASAAPGGGHRPVVDVADKTGLVWL